MEGDTASRSDTEAIFDYVLQTLVSLEAARIYILIAGLIVLVVSAYIAYLQLSYLRGIALDDFNKKFPGRTPESEEAIARREKRIDEFRTSRWRGLKRRLYLLLGFGYFIPSVVIFFAALNYSWFGLETEPFLNGVTDQLQTEVSKWEVFIFTLGQMTRGALLDVMEVFQWQIGALTNNPANLAVSLIILGYRTLMSAFTAVLAIFFWQSVVILRRLDRQ